MAGRPRPSDASEKAKTPTMKSELSTEGAKLSLVAVVNMSSRPLSAAELSVLRRGLSFVPTRRQTAAQLEAELKEWDRFMSLQEYWHGV